MLKILIPAAIVITAMSVALVCMAVTLKKHDKLTVEAIGILKDFNESEKTALQVIEALKEKDEKRDKAFADLYQKYFKVASIAGFFVDTKGKW